MGDGIEVYIVRPDVAIDATLKAEFNNNTTTYQGGYVAPANISTIKWFRFFFEGLTKPIKHSYDRTLIPNQGINTVPLRQIDHTLSFFNAFVGNYRTSTFAEYFKKGLEYAVGEWGKITEKYIQVVRWYESDESQVDFIWHYPSTAFVRFTGLIDNVKSKEDSFNNLYIDSLQISWGKLST